MFWSKKHPISLNFLHDGEFFIPVPYHEICAEILKDPRLSTQEQADLKKFSHFLQEHYHYDYHAELKTLKQAFTPFDPDSESVWKKDYTEEEKQKFRQEFLQSTTRLLKASNYRLLSEEELNECLRLQPYGGLSITVNTDAFDVFHVYYRGVRKTQKIHKKLYFLKNTQETLELKRIFVLAQYKKEYHHKILVKLFRDVPVENMKILAPEVRMGLPIFDRFKIGGTILGSIFTPFYKILYAATLSWWVFLTFLCFFIFALIKGILGFFNSRTRCLQVYSSSLYHQNLSNNFGAITTLIDQAEEQEAKEAFLAYSFLYLHREKAWNDVQLKHLIENWFSENFDFPIYFEVDDALQKLHKKNLIVKIPISPLSSDAQETPSEREASVNQNTHKNLTLKETSEHTFSEDLSQDSKKSALFPSSEETYYRVYNIPSSLRRLDENWDTLWLYNNDLSSDSDALAQ
ncbi:MAG: DUF3754 domain-containing protein [Planctomycetia bacterium]|nr:DUF3754 domain-containing protein [Planctomycetia bacterium]